MTTNELEKFIHQQIPLSQALQVHVVTAESSRVELKCPLYPNRNHLSTAFGGSLAAAAILACYTWIFYELNRQGFKVHVLLKSSTTDYSLPVEEDFSAVCNAPNASDFEKFLNTFKKKGLARIDLVSEIKTSKGLACRLQGEFVARLEE